MAALVEPSSLGIAEFNTGNQAWRQKQVAEALAAYTRATRLTPTLPWPTWGVRAAW